MEAIIKPMNIAIDMPTTLDTAAADDILNDDVLLEILKYLNVMDIISYRQVCSRFESNADNHLSRKVKQFHIDATLDHKSKEIIKHLGQHLKALHLVSVHSYKRVDKLRRQIQSINKYCTQLASLTIETRNWYGAMALSASIVNKLHFVHLRYLELHNIKMDKDFDLVAAFENIEVLKMNSIGNFTGQTLIGLNRLAVLHLNSCAQLRPNHLYDYFHAKGRTLKEIIVHKCRDIDEIILNEIVANLPNIELVSLMFSYTASFDPSTLHCLQHLKSLSLHNFKTYDVNRFIKLLATNNKLERWEINGENFKMYQLDGSAADKLEKSTNLNELSFVKCNFVTDDLLFRLGRNLNLTKFSLQDCWGFTVNGLMKFVQLQRQLAYLSIRNCTIPRSATIDIANMVLEDEERPAIHIDYDIDCGYRPFTFDFYDDEYDYEEYSPYDLYWDSDSTDAEI
ncbi:uncharacterized protein LOC116341899 [Contarinia nasturtii]|uniref:uncharacterized protein LOC116341899 n=1 Tax=Contarinia nasturtii TaxID=265458 RepID=UPI0012D4A388|nr:uncharacterized protein LOC116341899 [Contarinia nasturtii]